MYVQVIQGILLRLDKMVMYDMYNAKSDPND